MILHFTDQQRLAAEHLLDSPFGLRLEQVARTVERKPNLLTVAYLPHHVNDALSSGELVLLDVLGSLVGAARFSIDDLNRLDDVTWSTVVQTLFIAKGRMLASAGASEVTC